MRNQITRTITTFEVTFGNFDLRTMSVNNVTTRIYGVKPSKRRLAKDAPTGTTVLSVDEVSKTYAMDLDKFLALAEVVNGSEAPRESQGD